MGAELVQEQFDFSSPGAAAVDEGGAYPRIKGVRICGPTSTNGRDYPPEKWTPDVLAKYEGVASYVAHANGVRDPNDKIGWFENVTTDGQGLPVGDYCLNPHHKLTPTVLWAAKNKPDFFAMSHRAEIDFRPGGPGRNKVAESWNRVLSVDLVTQGGTTKGIYEHSEGYPVALTISAYANKLAPKCDVGQLLKLKRLTKSLVQEDAGDPMGDAPMMPDAPDPAADDTDADEGITAAFKAAFDTIRDKLFDGSMDKKSAFKKLSAIFDGHDDATETLADPAADAPADVAPFPAEESAKVVLARHTAIIEEASAEGFALTNKIDHAALVAFKTPAERIAYMRLQKGRMNASKPAGTSRGKGLLAEESGDKPATKTPAEEAADEMLRRAKALAAGRRFPAMN